MLKVALVMTLVGIVLGHPANLTLPGLRIVGGETTTIEQNPWQLALLYYQQHYCGAVQISASWALTSAHCLEGAIVDNLSVRAGSTTKSFGGQVVDVTRLYVHPNFNIRTSDYDFALLELAEPITVQTSAPASLPEPNAPVPSGETATLTGWGLLSSEGVASELLQKVQIPVFSNDICQLFYLNSYITDRMFCTGNIRDGGLDACTGDAGGPVIVKGKVYGLISWGRGCGEPASPGVNARVSEVLEWIYSTNGI